jgi:anti-sigma regulatory factor (Ser/Thr protein kinase)
VQIVVGTVAEGRIALVDSDAPGAPLAIVAPGELAEAVRDFERRGPRWVWVDTRAWYPQLLAAGVRIERCHDLRLCGAILAHSASTDAVRSEHPRPAWLPVGPSEPGGAPAPAEASVNRTLLFDLDDFVDPAANNRSELQEQTARPLGLTGSAATLVGEVLAEVEPLISRARLSSSTEMTGELPVITSDRQKLKQIVLNLLTNAIKFTPQGSVKVTCRYHSARREFAISVMDTGIGIAPQDLTKIFEDFRQADDSVTRQYGGAGLGLSICRRLAVILGGRIEVQSQVGRGSTFTFHAPRFGRKE